MNTDRLDKALSQLINEGSMSSEQGALLRQAYIDAPQENETRKSVFAEIAIYLGGLFVLFSTVLIAADKWDQSPAIFRTGSLGTLSVALLLLAHFIGDRNAMRLRLTSVLSMVSAIAATGAVALFEEINDAPWLPFTVGAIIALYSFIRYRHEIVHIGAYGYLFITGLMIIGKISGDEPEDSYIYPMYWVVLGCLWLYLSFTKVIEPLLGYLISAATLFLASQFLFATSSHVLSYCVAISASALFLWIFLRDRRWPLLLGVVAMTTFAVGEFVSESLGGSTGALVGLFAAGVALISSSLLALRKLQSVE
jgi:hypothetical protein